MTLTRVRVIAVCVVVAAVAVIAILASRERAEHAPVDDVNVEEMGEGVQSVVLSFAGRGGGRNVEERREIVVPEDGASRARRILEELAEGPRGDNADGTIPMGTRVLRVFFDDHGGAFVDMSSEFVSNHPGGSTGELFTIRSIVRTLGLNFPDVERVSLLVEGEEIETIAGHIDASIPFNVSEYR